MIPLPPDLLAPILASPHDDHNIQHAAPVVRRNRVRAAGSREGMMESEFDQFVRWDEMVWWVDCMGCKKQIERFDGKDKLAEAAFDYGWRIISGRLLCGECAKRETNTK